VVDGSWKVMAHAQKPDFVFQQNGRGHFNRLGHQFSRLLAAEACASAVVMLDTACSEVVWRVLAIHCIRQFRLHFPSCASPCAITFQLKYTICQCDTFQNSIGFCILIETSSTCSKHCLAHDCNEEFTISPHTRNLYMYMLFGCKAFQRTWFLSVRTSCTANFQQWGFRFWNWTKVLFV